MFETKYSNGLFIGEGVGGRLIVNANNVRDYITGVEANFPYARRGQSSIRRRSETGRDDFYQFETWDESLNVMKNEPEKLFQENVIEKELFIPHVPHTEVSFDVTGDYLDIGLLLDGEPEHWGYLPYVRPSQMFCTIAFNLYASCSVKEEALQLFSQYLVSLVDWLESHEVRTRIIGIGSNVVMDSTVNIKNYEEPLDRASIAVASSVDFFRRVMFRAMEHSNTWNSGYGSAEGRISHVENDISIYLPKEVTMNSEDIKVMFEDVITRAGDCLENNQRSFEITGSMRRYSRW